MKTLADQFITKKTTWSLYILYNIDIQVILFVYIFSFFEKQNTEWTSEPQPEPPIPQTISVPPATPTQIQVPRTQKPPEPRQQSFRQQPPPMKVNVPRPKTPIKNGTVLKDLLYKLRKTVFRYWMYGMTQVRSDFDWSTSYLLHTKNLYVLSIFCRLASHVINKFTEMLRYVRCARQRVVPATLRNQKGSWTSESKKSLPQQFMCTSSSRQVDGVFSRQIGGACGSDWEGASKP